MNNNALSRNNPQLISVSSETLRLLPTKLFGCILR